MDVLLGIDDITPLYEIKNKIARGDNLFKPRPAYRMQGGQSDDRVQELMRQME
jgi:hypothetical protein